MNCPESHPQTADESNESIRRENNRGDIVTHQEDAVVHSFPQPIHVEISPSKTSRLRRRGRPGYTVEELAAAGLTEEEIKGFTTGRDARMAQARMKRENEKALAAKQSPPHSAEAVENVAKGSAAAYQKSMRIFKALQAGNIAEATRLREAARGIRNAIPDETLIKALKDEAKVQRFKELRSMMSEWERINQEARSIGRKLYKEDLSPDHRRLDDATYEYHHMLREIHASLEQPGEQPIRRRRRNHKDAELKALLDLESLGDFAKGRRLTTEYNGYWREAIASSRKIAEMMSANQFKELLKGRRLYDHMLEVVRLKKEAVQRGQNPPSHRLEATEPPLFTPDEERRVKQVLDLQEIEEFVDGKRAQRRLAQAQAINEVEPREGRKPLNTPAELDNLQRQLDRYLELLKKVDQGQPQQDPQEADTNPRPVSNKQSSAQPGRRKKVRKGSDDPSSTDGPLKSVSHHPLSLVDQMKAGWKNLGDQGQAMLHSNHRTFSWPSKPSVLFPEVPVRIGSRGPARMAGPLPL